MRKIVLIKMFLFLWLVGATLSFVLHIFYPDLISDLSLWNISVGWQREIALWNLGASIGIIYALIKNNSQIYKFTMGLLLVISLLLGVNHLAALIIDKEAMLINLLGAILNLTIVVFGGFILKNEKN